MPIQDWIQESLKPGDLTLLQHIKSGSLPRDAEQTEYCALIKTGYLKKIGVSPSTGAVRFPSLYVFPRP